MERSLSILLPAYNAQHTLRQSVLDVLELAAELTPQFELLILDDGSTDHTIEVADELARHYPQVRVTRHAQPRGLAEVVRRGLQQTRGEIICVHEGQGSVEVADIRRLWQLRNDPDLVLARHNARSTAASEGWLQRLLGPPRRESAPAAGSGFHMLRRDAIEALHDGRALAASQHEVRLHRERGEQPGRGPRRPKFVEQVRHLALGE